MRKLLNVAVVVVCMLAVYYVSERAFAEPVIDSTQFSAALTRPCDITTKHPVTVSVSSSSALTSRAIAKGQVRILCTQDAHVYAGAEGVTGPTAGTGDTPIGLWSAEYFKSEGGYFAFIRNSTDGVCYLTECF